MRKLLKYLKKYSFEAVLGPLFKLLEATFELIVPLVVAAIIDNGIRNSDKPYIIRMSLGLILLAAVGYACSVTAQFFAAKAATSFAAAVKKDLFKNIQSLSYEQIDNLGTTTLITRMTSDINQVQQGVNLTLRLLLRSPFVVFGAMVMAFTIDFHQALIFLVTIAVLSAVIFGIMLWGIPRYKKIQELVDGVLGLTRENLSGVRVIRAFDLEKSENENFKKKNEVLTKLQEYVGRISALMNPITYVILNLAIIILLKTSADKVYAGILTTGAVVALYNYMSQILVELVKLASLIITVTRSFACGNRIQLMLEEKGSMVDGTIDAKAVAISDDEPVVSFENVSMRYKGDGDNSLSGVTFTAKKGESIGIIGGTGSGKTTLINLIPRFYDAYEGVVKYKGKDVREYDSKSLREVIGVVPQKAMLFKGTIRDNLKWGNDKATDDEIWDAVNTAQATEVVKEKKGELSAEITQAGKNFSGGQKQRLTIARALVRKPEVLILDDSSSALDNMTDKRLRKAISELPYKPVTFIVSQRAASVRFCDRIIVLDDGRVDGIGTHEELLANSETYREIYESQFGKEAVNE
ncbi:ABC transporter ATP-binding protein [Butyrivibrio sp. XPD2002]|uniref:ABC transporter ATP-binding protein n=1 Tax=Butyrivibrio sp. XPD2002 TaxID=1280665 RepID=UPI00040DF722|nr:ABC transporter ATP-binding protein [Butyrivibrio sp. XPD2002]